MFPFYFGFNTSAIYFPRKVTKFKEKSFGFFSELCSQNLKGGGGGGEGEG